MEQPEIVWFSLELNGVPLCVHYFKEENGTYSNPVDGRPVNIGDNSITHFDGTPVYMGIITEMKIMEPPTSNIEIPIRKIRTDINRYQSSDSAPKVAVLERNSHNHY